MTSLRQKVLLALFSLAFSLVILEVGLRAAGFIFLFQQEHKNRRVLEKREVCRVMCLGESTTFEQYPPYLQEALDRYDSGIKFSVIDKGLPGSNTSVILRSLERELNRYRPNIVVAMMGINDIAGKVPAETAEESLQPVSVRRLRTYKLFQWLKLQLTGVLQSKRDVSIGQLDEQLQTAISHIEGGDIEKADQLLLRVLEAYPGEPMVYYQVASCYLLENSLFARALEVLNKAMVLFPENPIIFVGMGNYYETHRQYSRAQEFYRKAIELMPEEPAILYYLSRSYTNDAQYDRTESLMQELLGVHPQSYEAHLELGWSYLYRRRYTQAEEMFRKADEVNPGCKQTYEGLYILYVLWGKDEDAESAYRNLTGGSFPSFFNNPVTKKNYRAVKDLLDSRGITFVCVPYPLLGQGVLQEMFTVKNKVVFVDNATSFRDVLKSTHYEAVFTDRFGGFFGHCTELGNRLIAENIARSIMRDVLYVTRE